MTINLGDKKRGMAWRDSQAAVLYAYASMIMVRSKLCRVKVEGGKS